MNWCQHLYKLADCVDAQGHTGSSFILDAICGGRLNAWCTGAAMHTWHPPSHQLGGGGAGGYAPCTSAPHTSPCVWCHRASRRVRHLILWPIYRVEAAGAPPLTVLPSGGHDSTPLFCLARSCLRVGWISTKHLYLLFSTCTIGQAALYSIPCCLICTPGNYICTYGSFFGCTYSGYFLMFLHSTLVLYTCLSYLPRTHSSTFVGNGLTVLISVMFLSPLYPL